MLRLHGHFGDMLNCLINLDRAGFLLHRRLHDLFRHVVDALHDAAQLAAGRFLHFLDRVGNIGDDGGRTLRAGEDILQHVARLFRALHPLRDAMRAFMNLLDDGFRLFLHDLDNRGNVLCRRKNFRGEIPHFIGNDREAAPVRSGLRRDNRGVQREQRRLIRDLVNHVQNRADVLRLLLKMGNRLDRAGVRALNRVHAARHFFHRLLPF